jgi:hypothetical protein
LCSRRAGFDKTGGRLLGLRINPAKYNILCHTKVTLCESSDQCCDVMAALSCFRSCGTVFLQRGVTEF